jgi:proteasome activator subunit 4
MKFGNVVQRAASTLRQNTNGEEDHTDAVLGVAKAIDVFMLEYGMSRTNFNTLQQNYTKAREWVLLSTFYQHLD